MQGQHAYISDYINGGVQVVDVSNPSSPFVSAFYKQSGCFAMQVALSGSLLYIADGPAGIGIYDHYVVTEIENGNRVQQSSAISCFPNPVGKYATVAFTLENAGEIQLELFDRSGRFVRVLDRRHCPSGENSISVNFSNESLMPGLYFIKLNTIDGDDWLKIIVNR
jgi:hypothetical protein